MSLLFVLRRLRALLPVRVLTLARIFLRLLPLLCSLLPRGRDCGFLLVAPLAGAFIVVCGAANLVPAVVLRLVLLAAVVIRLALLVLPLSLVLLILLILPRLGLTQTPPRFLWKPYAPRCEPIVWYT